jgi:hypothetical protein
MAKKRKKLTPELLAEWKATSAEVERMLRERIDETKLAEERKSAG